MTAAVCYLPVASAQPPAPPILPAVPNACALLSRSEVGKAVGTTVGEGESRIIAATFTRCLFSEANGGNAAVLVRHIPSNTWESEQRGRFQRGVQLATYYKIEGIGDQAYFAKVGQGSVLCVFTGEYYVQISLFRMREASGVPGPLERLAQSALARLKSGTNPRYGPLPLITTASASASTGLPIRP